MEVIDRTKAITQHFLEKPFKKLSIKKKHPKNTQTFVSKCMLRLGVLRIFVLFCVGFVRAILSWFPVTWHTCIYTVYNNFLWTSLQLILTHSQSSLRTQHQETHRSACGLTSLIFVVFFYRDLSLFQRVLSYIPC